MHKSLLNIIILLLASLCLAVQADEPVAEIKELSPTPNDNLENDPVMEMEKMSLIEMTESLVKLDQTINEKVQSDCDDSMDHNPDNEGMEFPDSAEPHINMEDAYMEGDQTDCNFYENEFEDQPFDYSPPGSPHLDEQQALPKLPVIDTFQQSQKKFEFITANQIFFDYDKATLSDKSKKVLDDISSYIEDTQTISRILIDGHTDVRASRNYNYRLSDRRALAVHDYLSKQGVSNEIMHIVGLGEDIPIDESWTRTGKQHNRRVEIYILQHNPQL